MTTQLATLDDVLLGMTGGALRAAQARLATARQDRATTKALATADLTAGGALAPVEHAAGTVQAVLPPSAAQMIREWVLHNLDPVDVIEVEETPHITVRYGFDPAVTVEQVTEVLGGVAPFRVLISGLGVFEGAEGGTRDVLVAWVADDSGSLPGLHEDLGVLPNTSTHDAYLPHMTLAFLPLGAGEAVLDSLTETPHLVIEVDRLEWRGADGTRAPLPLTGGLMPLTDAAGIGTKAWDESAHPREPGGAPDSTGGQFAASGGGADARPQYEVSTVKEAYALLSQHQRVILAKPSMVSTLLDKLAREVKKAKAAGTDAPNIDLCDVTVKDTNIFCEDSLGVPRIKMPQLKGVPIPGSPADRLPKDKNGKVVLDEPFHDYLEAQGLQITRGLVPAAFLKATQNELDGAKAAKFLRKYEEGWVQDRALFVSADNYIVDGHHHWAAKVAQDARAANDVDRPFRIQRIHAPILEILVHALKFSTDMGVPPAPVFAKKKGGTAQWDEDLVAPYTKEWDESLHPRIADGTFTESGGGTRPAGDQPGGSMRDLIGRLDAPDGGFTIHPFTGRDRQVPSTGFMVSVYPERSKVLDVKEVTAPVIAQYIVDNTDVFNLPSRYFGAWHDPETHKVWFDISVHSDSEAAARAMAQQYKQIAYFDLAHGKSVPVGQKEDEVHAKSPVASRVKADGGGRARARASGDGARADPGRD